MIITTKPDDKLHFFFGLENFEIFDQTNGTIYLCAYVCVAYMCLYFLLMDVCAPAFNITCVIKKTDREVSAPFSFVCFIRKKHTHKFWLSHWNYKCLFKL